LVPIQRWRGAAVDLRAPALRLDQPCKNFQESGFARAVGTEHRKRLAGLDAERHVVEALTAPKLCRSPQPRSIDRGGELAQSYGLTRYRLWPKSSTFISGSMLTYAS